VPAGSLPQVPEGKGGSKWLQEDFGRSEPGHNTLNWVVVTQISLIIIPDPWGNDPI